MTESCERCARLRELILASRDHAARVAMYNPPHVIAEAWERLRNADKAVSDHGDLEDA